MSYTGSGISIPELHGSNTSGSSNVNFSGTLSIQGYHFISSTTLVLTHGEKVNLIHGYKYVTK